MAIKTPPAERAGSRKRLAKLKQALPDGSFIIPTVAYLKKALQAVGRAAPGKRPALAALIRKRARELGAWNVVSGTWADNTQGATAMTNALRVQLLELGMTPHQVTLELAATPMVASGDGTKTTSLGGNHADHPVFKRVLAKMKGKMSAANAAKMASRACAMHDKASSGKA